MNIPNESLIDTFNNIMRNAPQCCGFKPYDLSSAEELRKKLEAIDAGECYDCYFVNNVAIEAIQAFLQYSDAFHSAMHDSLSDVVKISAESIDDGLAFTFKPPENQEEKNEAMAFISKELGELSNTADYAIEAIGRLLKGCHGMAKQTVRRGTTLTTIEACMAPVMVDSGNYPAVAKTETIHED